MKTIYLLSALCLLSLQSAVAQFIWHPDLGVPRQDTIRVSYNTRSRMVEVTTGEEFGSTGDIWEALDAQLTAAGITWIRVNTVENPASGTYEIWFDLDENTEYYSRSIHLGYSSVAYTIFTQRSRYDYPTVELPASNQFIICPGEEIELKLSQTAENDIYKLERTSAPTGEIASYRGTGKDLTDRLELTPGTYKFKNFGDEFEVSYYDAFSYMYSFGDEVISMDANGGIHKIYFDWYIDENMQQHSVSWSDDIAFLTKPFESYNAGNSKYWNPHIRLSYGFDEEVNRAYIQITCPPNLSPESINNGSGLMVSEHICLDIQQSANGSVVHFPTDYKYNKRTSYIEITVENTQPYVIYTLYKNGIPQEFIGNDEPHIVMLPKAAGEYKIVAYYEEGEYHDQKELIRFWYNDDMLAVDNEKNWIATKTYVGEDSPIFDLDYFNGLGLLTQSVGVEASPNGFDYIQPVSYDERMRADSKIYLPYEAVSYDGRFRPSIVSEQSTYYAEQYGSADGARAFSEQVYEAVPFNRVKKQAIPGVMRDTIRYTVMDYRTNKANEVYKLSVGNNGALVCNDYYAKGVLSCNETVDADGRKTLVFSNGLGQTVLNRRIDGVKLVDTYSAYDADGLLKWVVSPNGSDSLRSVSPVSLLSGFARRHCYAYVYDNRGNILEKHLPDRDPIYYIYDGKDRLVMQQDGNMRAGKYTTNHFPQWITYKYDTFGRLSEQRVVTENAETPTPRNVLQNQFDRDEVPTLYEMTSAQLLSQHTYDSYTGCPESLAFVDIDDYTTETTNGQTRSLCDRRVVGLPTYEKVALIGSSPLNNYYERAFYYDYKGAVIQIVEVDNTNNIHRTSNKYDFAGNLIAQYESYTHDTTDCVVRTYSYDHRNRLIKETAQLNEGEQAVVSYTYDGLGRFLTKKYGEGADAIDETYAYNIQGGLTMKNNDLFHLDLRYYNSKYPETSACYNGDISELHWQHLGTGSNDSDENSYAFSYDKMARLYNTQQYINSIADNQNVERRLLYDKNGNLRTLLRYKNGIEADNQLFEHIGNQILDVTNGKVRDATIELVIPWPPVINPDTSSFLQPTRALTYIYDHNGNIAVDYYKSGLSYSYNVLNLLACAEKARKTGFPTINNSVNYVYLADGTKISAERSPIGNRYKYIGSFVYSMAYSAIGNGSLHSLEGISFGDGRILAGQSGTAGTFTPHYFLTDHLGSVRVVAEDKNTVMERNDYYPFGERWETTEFPVSNNRYRFNGKENQSHVGLSFTDYGARMYGSGICRWISQDPMSEKYYITPSFVYRIKHPINYTDLK